MTTELVALEEDLEQLKFSKPKKYKNGEIMISKIKKGSEPILVQFPKMSIASDYTKFVELEFTSDSGYSKKVYNFLSKLDDYLITVISKNSEEWFGKQIPMENINVMYNKFIKAPKSSENKCTINFVFDKKKSQLINKKDEELDVSELVKGNTLECISQLKYIVFSKETCFVNWEITTAKLHKKIVKVPKFGFVEDPIEQLSDSDTDEENLTFW